MLAMIILYIVCSYIINGILLGYILAKSEEEDEDLGDRNYIIAFLFSPIVFIILILFATGKILFELTKTR